MWQSWVNGILGIVLFALAFFNLSGTTLAWTLGIMGVIIAIVGFSATSASEESSSMSHAL
jgi:hypothetical protein